MRKTYNKDCFEVLKTLESESIDLIITDPPYYQISKEDWDNQWETPEEYLDWLLDITKEFSRLLIDGGSYYIFGNIGPKNGFIFWDYIKKVNEKYFKMSSYIIWRHFRPKGYKNSQWFYWPAGYDAIAYFFKGDKPKIFNKQNMHEAGLSKTSQKRFEDTGVGLVCTNVWFDIPEAQLDGGMNRTLNHPQKKPLKVMERLIIASSNKGDLVLDPFMGSGTTIVAAKKLGRQYIGVEKSKKYYKIARERIIKGI